MRKSDPINQNDEGFNAQIQNFSSTAGSYSAAVGLTAADLAAQTADAKYFNYVIQCQKIMVKGGQQATTWKDIIRDGGTPPPTGAPVAPVFPTPAPTAVAPGIEARFRSLIQRIKSSLDYNPSIGMALGIEGAQQTGPDLTTVQPLFDVTVSGNHVNVNWSWQGNAAYLDICEIQVDRGDGKGFVMLAFDTTPGYADTQSVPATPTKWTYRAIYRVGDDQVGLWSLPVSIVVGG